MAYQTQFEGYVAYKAQSALGSIASGGSAEVLPIVSGSSETTVAAIGSKQIRQDGLSVRGRHGQQGFTAQYNGELQLTNFDTPLAAIMRANWGTTGAAIDQTTCGQLTVSGSVITFVTAAPTCSIYDVVVFTSGVAAADRDRPLRVVGRDASAKTLTVAEALTTVGVAADFSMKVKGRKLVSPAGGSLIKTYFTLEEYESAIDVSTVAQDFMWSKIDIAMQPDSIITCALSGIGTGNVTAKATGDSPYFTSPVVTAATPLSVIDATIRLGSGDVVDLESFSLSIDLGTTDAKVIGATYSPDLFPGNMKVSGSITALRTDLAYFAAMLNETSYSLMVTAVVPGTTDSFFHITVPYFTLGTVKASDFTREGGPRTQTLSFPAELVGYDQGGTNHDTTMVKFQESP